MGGCFCAWFWRLGVCPTAKPGPFVRFGSLDLAARRSLSIPDIVDDRCYYMAAYLQHDDGAVSSDPDCSDQAGGGSGRVEEFLVVLYRSRGSGVDVSEPVNGCDRVVDDRFRDPHLPPGHR